MIKSIIENNKDLIESDKRLKEFIDILSLLYLNDVFKENIALYKNKEDNSIMFEIIFKVKRVYISFEKDNKDSFYGFIFNYNNEFISYSNLLSNINNDYKLLTYQIANFINNNDIPQLPKILD